MIECDTCVGLDNTLHFDVYSDGIRSIGRSQAHSLIIACTQSELTVNVIFETPLVVRLSD